MARKTFIYVQYSIIEIFTFNYEMYLMKIKTKSLIFYFYQAYINGLVNEIFGNIERNINVID